MTDEYRIGKHTSNVHGHLLDLGAVELLNLTHHADIVSGDEVDGNTLTTETTTTTDTVNVVLTVGGQVVVNNKRDLLDINTTGQKVSGDEDTRRTRAELLHDNITLALLHVTVHGRDGKVTSSELVGKPVDLSAGVAEDDGLGDGDGLVEVRERVELPLLLLDGNVELLDTLKGKFLLLDQDTDGVAHELGGDLQNVLGHGSRKQGNLGRLGEELEDVVDLLGETTLLASQYLLRFLETATSGTYRKHLIGLVKDEQLHLVRSQDTALDHIVDTAGGTDNDLGALTEGRHVLTDVGTTNTGVALDLHEVTNGDNDLLDLLSKLTSGSEDQSLASLQVGVDLLESGDGEGGSLASTGLGLSNDIVT